MMWSHVGAMSAVMFDTLKFAERLESGGFAHEQATAFAMAFSEAMGERDAATRGDVGIRLRDIETKLAQAKADILRWMFVTALIQVVATVTLIKLL